VEIAPVFLTMEQEILSRMRKIIGWEVRAMALSIVDKITSKTISIKLTS
jgi:hypothetical protein